MVRVKFSTKPPPHWKVHSSAARKRQQTKKGRQSKVDNDDETWLLLPEPSSNLETPEIVETTKVVIATPRAGTRLHAAMEMIPVEDIVGRLYHLSCPPTNTELVSHARVFVEAAAKLDAAGEIKDAAETILVDLAFTINGRGTGEFPVGMQYECLRKQFTFIEAIIDLNECPKKLVTAKPVIAKRGTAEPLPKRVKELRGIPKSDRVLRSRAPMSK